MSANGLRPLFRIAAQCLRLLSSMEFLAWIIGSWILLYSSSMIWTRESFSYFMNALRSSLAVQMPFVLFLVSGCLNLGRVSASLLRRGRRRFLTMTVLPLGGLVFLAGFFVSGTTRQFDWIVVKAGDVMQAPWSADRYYVQSIDPGVRDRFLDIDIESGRGLFAYEPKVVVRDEQARTSDIGAFPPVNLDGTYYHVLNFGLAPQISISEAGAIQAREYVPLRILGPGSVDTLTIEPLPYRFLFSLEPIRTIQKGETKASEYSLRSPLYRVRVLEGEQLVKEEVSREGIHLNGVTIWVHDSGFWVQMEAVRDHGVLLIVGGILLAAAGLPLFVVGAVLLLKRRLSAAVMS